MFEHSYSIGCLSYGAITFHRVNVKRETTQGQVNHDPDAIPTLAKGELVMIAATSGNSGYLGISGLKEMVYENRMSYADKWGHEFMWADISSYNFSKVPWNKIPIIQDAHVRYPKAKWFWWLDFDAIIMNASIDIYTHTMQNILFDVDIPRVGGGSSGFRTPATMDDVNMLITFDHWGMNTGSFMMRRSEWTDVVLEMWADPLAVEKDWAFFDQDGWVHIYQHHELVRKHTGLVKQKVLNGYPGYNFLGDHWEPGELLVHFAGCSASKNLTRCLNHWTEYWGKRETKATPEWISKQLADGKAPIENVKQSKN